MILKSETDGHMGPEDMDPRKSTCSLPTDTSQPSKYPDIILGVHPVTATIDLYSNIK